MKYKMYNYPDKLEPISQNSSLYEFFTETNNDLDIQNELETVEDDLHRNNINPQTYENDFPGVVFVRGHEDAHFFYLIEARNGLTGQ